MLLDTHTEHLPQTTEKSMLSENPPSPLKERKYVRKEGKGREKGEDHGGAEWRRKSLGAEMQRELKARVFEGNDW